MNVFCRQSSNIFLVCMNLLNHVDKQRVKPCKRFNGLFGTLQVCKNMRFHCAAGLVALRICAPKREEHCL